MSRILVIDDDEAVRNMLKTMIASMGYEVAEAADGTAGIAAAQEWMPEVVLTDIIMPGKGGLEVIVDLRRMFPKMKIVAISGGSRVGGINEYLKLAGLMGAHRILPKPFTIQELELVLAELLGRGSDRP